VGCGCKRERVAEIGTITKREEDKVSLQTDSYEPQQKIESSQEDSIEDLVDRLLEREKDKKSKIKYKYTNSHTDRTKMRKKLFKNSFIEKKNHPSLYYVHDSSDDTSPKKKKVRLGKTKKKKNKDKIKNSETKQRKSTLNESLSKNTYPENEDIKEEAILKENGNEPKTSEEPLSFSTKTPTEHESEGKENKETIPEKTETDKKISTFSVVTDDDTKNDKEQKPVEDEKKNIIDVPKKDEPESKDISLKKQEPIEEKRDESSIASISSDEDIKDIQSDSFIKTPQQETSTTSSPNKLSDEVKGAASKISPANQVSQQILTLKDKTIQELGFTEKDWEELDFYTLEEPFAYVEIIRDINSLDKRYVLLEVQLSDEEQGILDFLKETLTTIDVDTEKIEELGIDEYLREQVEKIFVEYKLTLSDSSKQKVVYYLEKYYLGLGLIDALMKDPNIEDISCDGARVPIFLYHREYGSLRSNIEFNDEEKLSGFVVRLAQKCGKHISIAEPMLDATMPDGSRIQMTLSTEVTAKGSTFTIRKFKEDPFSPPDLIEFNTMSSEMVAYMWMAVENGVNALIAGGTAAGKTSTLNALSLFIPRESKIVSIEETREINLPHPNWIPGVARSGFGEVVADKVIGEIDMYDLMKAALRQRPEYILVGEIRGKEAYVLFQAMATGHTTYSTAHADSAQSLIHRLEGKPIEIPRIMLQALDIVCIQVTTRVKNKRARRCKQIIEIIDIDPTTKEILTNEVFRWDPVEDTFIYSGKSYVLESIRIDKDLAREDMTNEIKNRSSLMNWMNTQNIRDFREVATLLAQYAEDPEDVLKQVKE